MTNNQSDINIKKTIDNWQDKLTSAHWAENNPLSMEGVLLNVLNFCRNMFVSDSICA